jgi:hypothetical protein
MTPYPTLGKPKAKVLLDAFVEGCGDRHQKAAVFYGVNDSNIQHWWNVRSSGMTYYTIDNSYFDETRGFKEPHAQFRVTKNKFQCDACYETSNGRRFEALGIELKPWKKPTADSHVVVCPQSEEFMRDIAKYPGNWMKDALHRMDAEGSKAPAVIRMWDRDKVKLARSLPQDLENAHLLVTHSSAAAVTALIRGVPVQVSSMSALWGCRFDTSDDADGGRLAALGVLADNQWSISEIKSGRAWTWLNK